MFRDNQEVVIPFKDREGDYAFVKNETGSYILCYLMDNNDDASKKDYYFLDMVYGKSDVLVGVPKTREPIDITALLYALS